MQCKKKKKRQYEKGHEHETRASYSYSSSPFILNLNLTVSLSSLNHTHSRSSSSLSASVECVETVTCPANEWLLIMLTLKNPSANSVALGGKVNVLGKENGRKDVSGQPKKLKSGYADKLKVSRTWPWTPSYSHFYIPLVLDQQAQVLCTDGRDPRRGGLRSSDTRR